MKTQFVVQHPLAAHVAKSPYRIRAVAPLISIEEPGRLRFCNLMALFGVSHQTLRTRMKQGLIPLPDGYDGVRPFWLTATVRPYLIP